MAKSNRKPKKQKRAKKAIGCLFIILLLFGCGAGFLIYHNKKAGDYIEEKAPTVKTVVDALVPIVKDATDQPIPVIEKYIIKAAVAMRSAYDYITEKLSDISDNSEGDTDTIDDSNPEE